MSLFTIATASGLTDRIAAIVTAVDTVLVAARTASAPGDLFRRVSSPNVYDIEKDLITPTYEFEQVMSGVTLFATNPKASVLVNALDSHTQRVAAVTFNTFLTNSGLQVPEPFAQLYGSVRGSQLNAHNVFAGRDIVLATTTKVGAGNWTFAAGQNLGSGGTNAYDSTTPNTGEQNLLAYLPSGVTTTNCTISVSGLDDAGRTSQAATTFTNNISGSTVLVSAGARFRTVTNISVTTDTAIPNGSAISIVNKRERLITY